MENENKSISLFGYELIRDDILSTILGKNEEDILYWCGKEIARKYPLINMEEAPSFFEEAGWGTLTFVKSSKDEAFYTLTGDVEQLKIDKRCFRLEAGFLAAQKQRETLCITECYDEKSVKANEVKFQIKWDRKDPQNI